MILEILQEINESRTESGKGSEKGREKYTSKEGTTGKKVKSRKSRVKVYPTIKAALDSAAPYGHIFSTKAADRLYVITRPQWGKKSTAGGNTRVAKGFTPGAATPSASWPSIKGHAMRTSIKHGKISSSRLKKKYGAGTERPEERRYAGKTSKRKSSKGKTNEAQEANPWAICHAELGKEKTAKFERCVMKVKAKHGIKDWNEFKEKLKVLESMPATQKRQTGTRVFRKSEDPAKAGGQGSQGTGNLPGSGVRRRKDVAAALRTSTEYEGPSLREKLARLKEEDAAGYRERMKKETAKAVAQGRGRREMGTHRTAALKPKQAGVDRPRSSLGEMLKYLSEQPQYQSSLVTRTHAGGARAQGPTSGRMSKPAHKQVKRSESRKGGGVKRPHEMEPEVAHTEYEGPSLAETKDWIQGAEADIKRRGTEGKCTPITKPGCTGKAKALAKTFKKMAKKRDKDIVSKKEKRAKGK